MPDTFPTVREPRKTPLLRKRTGARSRKAKPNEWTRERIDYGALEAAKQLVGTLVYKDIPPKKEGQKGFKKEFRVSVLPWSKSGYFDCRLYLNGNPTGQGILCHLDRFDELLGYILDAKAEVDRMKAAGLIGDGT